MTNLTLETLSVRTLEKYAPLLEISIRKLKLPNQITNLGFDPTDKSSLRRRKDEIELEASAFSYN